MRKLTLSVDPRVVERAKRYARTRGTSVSKLVEQMLDLAAARPPGPGPDGVRDAAVATPVLTRLRGSIRRGSREDHRRYLERKYR